MKDKKKYERLFDAISAALQEENCTMFEGIDVLLLFLGSHIAAAKIPVEVLESCLVYCHEQTLKMIDVAAHIDAEDEATNLIKKVMRQ